MQKQSFFYVAFLIFVWSCKENSTVPETIQTQTLANSSLNLPSTPYNYSNVTLPTHLKTNVLNGIDQAAALESDNTPTTNPTTDHGATLGRVLFYDKNLSQNKTVACASCHIQEQGFADPAKTSKGFAGGLTRRHSMGLVNARFYKRGRFFWDERAATLEEQVLMPLQDEIEMGMTLTQVVSRINEQPYYKQLFTNAFGSAEVSSDKVSKALAQFIRSMISVSSKYDTGRSNVTQPMQAFSNFTASENSGKSLFFLPPPNGGFGCIGCHSSEAFITPTLGTTSNGLDAVSTTDKGVFEAIPNQRFLGTFKVPSLKNIAVTAPYMHDGRFATLTDVIDHYSNNIQAHINLGNGLKDNKGNPIRFNMTQKQKDDLLAFLNTLTDNTMLADPKFSNPFIK